MLLLAESSHLAIAGGLGSLVTALAVGVIRFVNSRRNGNGPSAVERTATELHKRVTDEMSRAEDRFVRKDVCKIVSEQLKNDITEIKTGVNRLIEHTFGER